MDKFLKRFAGTFSVLILIGLIAGIYGFVDQMLYDNAETIQGSYSSEFCENKENDGKKVVIDGYITTLDSFYSDGDDLRMLLVEDGGEGQMDVKIKVDDKDSNTMDMLPDMYYDSNVKLRDENGNVVNIFEDKLELVGKYTTSDCSLEKVTNIKVIESESE